MTPRRIRCIVAWTSLSVAAAEDHELREYMRPVEKRVWRLTCEVAADALLELASDLTFDARIAIKTSTLRDLGMLEHFASRRDEGRRDTWPIIYRASLELLLLAPVEALDGATRRRHRR